MKLVMNPYWEVIVASTIFGMTGIFVKYLALPPTSIAFFRLVVPTVLIGIRMWYTQKSFWKTWDMKTLFLLSILNALRMYLYFVWFTMTSVGNAVVALYTSPIFAMLFAVWLLGEKMNSIRYMSLLFAVCGLVVIGYGRGLSLSDGDMIGIIAITLSAFVQWYVTVLLKTSLRTYDKISLIFYQCLVGAIVFAPFVFFADVMPNVSQSSLAIGYAFLIGIVWFALYFSALKQLDATVVSILTYLEMVSGIIFAWLILSEPLTLPLIVGALLIVVSGVVLRLERQFIVK